jgi:hypothetical protein
MIMTNLGAIPLPSTSTVGPGVEPRNLRRGRERVDGLEYLCKDGKGSFLCKYVHTQSDYLTDSALLVGEGDLQNTDQIIAFDLLRLYYLTGHIKFLANSHMPVSFQRLTLAKLQRLMDREGLNFLIDMSKHELRDEEWKLKCRVKGMSPDELLRLMRNTEFVGYFKELLGNAVGICITLKRQDFFPKRTEYEMTHSALVEAHRIMQDLRTHIGEAMALRELDKESLEGLRLKMEALNEDFYDAGAWLGHDPPDRNLIWNGDQWWYVSL